MKNTHHIAALSFSILATVWLSAFSANANDNESAAKPNVLLLVSDDQRPDTLGIGGNEIIKTPNLDQLARNGVRFTRAVCGNPICTPSRAEILTGASGFQNGVMDFGGKINPAMTRFAQAMQSGGYRTCYVGKWHNNGLPRNHGYESSRAFFKGGGKPVDQVDYHGREVTGYRGWVFQEEGGKKYPEHGVGLTANISQTFADAAIAEIESKTEKPFFLHVNFTAPHDPLLMPPGFENKYDPKSISLPENFAGEHPFDHGNLKGRDEVLLLFPRTEKDVRADIAVYYSVISHLDKQIGRIIAALKDSQKLDNTIVIFTSDHGLAMGSHGLRGKQNMYEHTIGVPLILHGPNIPANKTRDAQVYLRDIYPTVCELCGIEIPSSVTATSFVECIDDAGATTHEHVVCYFRDLQRAIRGDRWKLIHYPKIDRYQLFDLQDDPNELNDLSSDKEYIDLVVKLRSSLAKADATLKIAN